jgi:ComF family protein
VKLLGLFGGLFRETRCMACNAVAPRGPEPILCDVCTELLAPYTGPRCPHCALPKEKEAAACGECPTKKPPWESLSFHGLYDGLLADLIKEFKYEGALGRSRFLQLLTAAAFKAEEGKAPDMIVPIPLHEKRLRERGFNQSLELSRLLAKKLGIPICCEALARSRYTVAQAKLKGQERRENLKGVFVAREELVQGKRVLLVDDVMTTGTTLVEAGNAFRAVGAQALDVLIAARTGVGRQTKGVEQKSIE